MATRLYTQASGKEKVSKHLPDLPPKRLDSSDNMLKPNVSGLTTESGLITYVDTLL